MRYLSDKEHCMLILELMARGRMKGGEVLNFTPADIQERTLIIQNPKNGRTGEAVYVPQKLLIRLNDYARMNKICLNEWISPISYVATWSMVNEGGRHSCYRDTSS